MACNTENLAGELLRHEFRNTTRAEDAGGRRGSDLPPLPIFLWPLPEGGQGERASVALQFSRPGVAAGRDFVIQGKVAAFPDPPTLTGGYYLHNRG